MPDRTTRFGNEVLGLDGMLAFETEYGDGAKAADSLQNSRGEMPPETGCGKMPQPRRHSRGRIRRWPWRRGGAGRDPCGNVFRSGPEKPPSRGGQVARGARRGGGGAGKRKAQRVFVRTIFVRGKIGGDGSLWLEVRRAERSEPHCLHLCREPGSPKGWDCARVGDRTISGE